MKSRKNFGLFLIGMISLSSYHLTITNDFSNSAITREISDEQALVVMIQDNEDRINRVFALCEDENEDMETFMEKAHALIQEHLKWQQNNVSFLSNFNLAQPIDVLWIETVQKLQQSVENETNSLVKQKKITAIHIISEGLKGNLHTLLYN